MTREKQGDMGNGFDEDGTWRSPRWRGCALEDEALAGWGAGSEYETRVADDAEIRRAVHEMRKVSDDIYELFRGEQTDDGRNAMDAAYRRYERVAENLNRRVLGEVSAWFRKAHEQKALVLALATSGVDTESEMVEVLEIVLMELDGTVAYHQKLRPQFAFGGEIAGTEIHGHTVKSLAHEPTFAEAYAGFVSALEGRRVIAYNAPWVARVLELECERNFKPNPLEGVGLDACVMAHRSRFAGQYMVSTSEYKSLPLGSPDSTPMGVARTMCDVVEAYRTENYYRGPETPYDPWERGDWEFRVHKFGWKDKNKPEDYETDSERDARHEREHRETEEKREARVAELVAGGMSKEEAEQMAFDEAWEDIPF